MEIITWRNPLNILGKKDTTMDCVSGLTRQLVVITIKVINICMHFSNDSAENKTSQTVFKH